MKNTKHVIGNACIGHIFGVDRLPGHQELELRSRPLKTSGKSMREPRTSPGAISQMIYRA